MKKDYKKILKAVYCSKPNTPMVLSVPEMNYLMISGQGHPESETFAFAAQTLFPIAYLSKFIVKARNPADDFVVMPMEVKWRITRTRKCSTRFSWTMMIMQPRCITQEIVDEARRTLIRKKKILPLNDSVRFQSFNEGLCGQIFHVGPYGKQMEVTFGLLKDYLTNLNYEWESDSHDVYFNDIRRTSENKLKTLMRVRIWQKNGQKPNLEDPFLIEDSG